MHTRSLLDGLAPPLQDAARDLCADLGLPVTAVRVIAPHRFEIVIR